MKAPVVPIPQCCAA